MRILDLFCGSGGAAMGYHYAYPDAQIVGVDIDAGALEEYPFEAIRGNAYAPPVDLDAFDLIHASPPCQAFSTVTPAAAKQDYPDDIQPVRDLIGDRPHVIENVRGAGLGGQLMLCGSMVGLQVQRHRYFEHNLPLIMAPACNHKAWHNGRPHTVTGHASGSNLDHYHHYGYHDTAHAADIMGMQWVTDIRGITEAIPPAYTEYIGLNYAPRKD